jgi:hypothetical protein
MKPALAIVANEATIEVARAASLAGAKHICDEARTEIAKRNWTAVHIAADRRQPVAIEDCKKRTWR